MKGYTSYSSIDNLWKNLLKGFFPNWTKYAAALYFYWFWDFSISKAFFFPSRPECAAAKR